MRYVATVSVAGRLPDVFDYLARFSSAADWDPGVAEAKQGTADPVALGTKFDLVAVFLGNRVPMTYEIVEYERPNRVVLLAETATARSLDTITFAKVDDSTTAVTYDAILDFKGIARLAAPLLSLAFRKTGDRAAAGLASCRPPRN